MALHDEQDKNDSLDPIGQDAEEYRAILHRYLMRRLRNREEARDIAQEAYLRYLQIPDLSRIRNPGGYLFRIASNLIHESRQRSTHSKVTYNSDLADKCGNQEDEYPDGFRQVWARERLQKMLDDIPFIYRRVLWMNKVEGLSYRQIAQKLNLAPKTILVYLSRAAWHIRRQQLSE